MFYFLMPYYKSGGISTIMRVFAKEGIMYLCVRHQSIADAYSIVMFFANALNVAFFVQTNFTGQAINAGFSLVMSSVMSCRLVLSLRDNESNTNVGRSSAGNHGGASFWTRSAATAPPSYASPVSTNPLPKANSHALPFSRYGDDFSEKPYDRNDSSPPQTSSGIRVETTVHVATD